MNRGKFGRKINSFRKENFIENLASKLIFKHLFKTTTKGKVSKWLKSEKFKKFEIRLKLPSKFLRFL